MKKITLSVVLLGLFTLNIGCKNKKDINDSTVAPNQPVTASEPLEAKLFLNLPETFNSPASADFDKEGNIYFTSPNFHNDVLIKSGHMKDPAAPTIGKIEKDNTFSTWYTFKPEDMEKSSGKVAPMGIAFGPDGNAYIADMQLWFNGESRILRLNVESGKVMGVDVVAVGFSFPNALAWKGSDLYITDTVLGETEDGKEISGVYRVTLEELNAGNPLNIKSYKNNSDHDIHLFESFISNGSLKFGANGLTIDGHGNLYTGIMEDGTILKTTMDEQNNKIETTVFAKGMIATDGMKWDARTNKIYIADLFANAIYAIDMDGTKTLLVKSDDNDGSGGQLDAPSEVIVRADEIIVMNFDAVFENPNMVNTTVDQPHTLSIIKI